MPFFGTQDSISLFYTLHGDPSNPPILLIHGWCCDSHDWSWQIPFLSKTHHVIAFDLRGHGKSSAPESVPYTPPAFVADSVALLQHLKIQQKVIVLGHSMGAVTASVFAVQHPNVVKGIVLVDPAYWHPGAECDAFMAPVREAPEKIHEATIASYKHNLTHESNPEWLKTWYYRRVEGTPAHVVRACLEGLYAPGAVGREEVHQELIAGKRSKVPRLAVNAKPEEAEKERGWGMGEGDEVATIEGVGHWPHHVRSEVFNEILGKWLEKIEKI